jgi:hypothetical protein
MTGEPTGKRFDEEAAVAFTLHLQTCNLGTKVRMLRNPFTNDPVVAHIDQGLTATERQAVRELLEEVKAGEVDPDAYRRVKLPDGSLVDVGVGSLYDETTCGAFAVDCSDLTDQVASFLHTLASRGNLSIGSTIDPQVVALPRREQKERVSERWPKAREVKSPSQLFAWLRQNLRKGTIV